MKDLQHEFLNDKETLSENTRSVIKQINLFMDLLSCFSHLIRIIKSIDLCLQTVGAGSNKQHSANKDSAKLDRETEELHRKSLHSNPI